DVLQTKRDWVHFDELGQLIHVNFTREVIRRRRKPTIRTLPQRRLRVVKLNVLIRKVVLDLHSGSARVVVVKLPRRYSPIILHTRTDFNHTGRTEIRPLKFLFTRPDKLD